MSAPAASLPEEVLSLIEQKDLEALEDLWTRKMEEEPEDLPFFFAVAAAVKKKGNGAAALNWLRFLSDYQAEVGRKDARLAVLLEIARMSPGDETIRGELAERIRERFAGHPALSAVLARFPLEGAADPAETGGRVLRWLGFALGEIYLMTGRGAGRIAELNPALDVIRFEVGSSRIPLSLVSAEKNLRPLPSGHFLRDKLENGESLRALAREDPAEAVRRLLESLGRPLSVAEIREHTADVVEEARWSAFWAAARKHPRLLVAGAGKTATVTWTASADAAEEEVRKAFLEADPAGKLELGRKHARRSKALARFFGEGLAGEARNAAASQPGLAWELSQAAARLLPEAPEAFPAGQLVVSKDLLGVLAEVRDHTARESALKAIREGRSDWAVLFAEQFLREEDARVLAALFRDLGDLAERREDLARRILRSPRLAPRAFLWLVEHQPEKEKPAGPALFFALLDALRREEFAPLRARVKQFFEPGQLAVRLAQSAASEEEAREMLAALDRVGGLEDHRRSLVREALLMKFPDLRAPARDYLYATPEAIEARRRELAHLKQVELPANAQAMRAAQELGDLSENFEYHAARQKHEYLSARIASLVEDLSRSRALDLARIDTSRVRVGTRVRLRDAESGAERVVTILGPWDSRPEEGIYSYQSEFAQALLGKAPGERAQLPEGEAVIVGVMSSLYTKAEVEEELGAPE